jgi:hypothetical protein
MNHPDQPPNAERNAEIEFVEKLATQLGEHFQSVRIFVSKSSDDGNANTLHYNTGRGDFLSQRGHVRDWMLYNDEATREKARIDQRRFLGEGNA